MSVKKKVDGVSLELLKASAGKKQQKFITQDVVDEINLLIEDPDYGEEFKENVVTYMSGIDGVKFSLKQYLNAVKYYSIYITGVTQLEAYTKVFPERVQARLDAGQTLDKVANEATRFNSTDLVNKIRSQAAVPFHLVNQGVRQKAVNQLTKLMMEARSDVAKVSAATALLKELKPPEAHQVELQIGLTDEAREAQEKQSTALLDIAANQRRLLEAGHNINDVQQLHVTKKEYIDVDLDDE